MLLEVGEGPPPLKVHAYLNLLALPLAPVMSVADHWMLPPTATEGLLGLMVQAAWPRLGQASALPTSINAAAMDCARRLTGG